MKKENVEIIVKELSEKFNKKEQIIKCMVQILEKENYNLKEVRRIIVGFMSK